MIQRITARAPTLEAFEELDLSAGVAVMMLRKTCVDTDGRVVEVADVMLPGDLAEREYATPLDRW